MMVQAMPEPRTASSATRLGAEPVLVGVVAGTRAGDVDDAAHSGDLAGLDEALVPPASTSSKV